MKLLFFLLALLLSYASFSQNQKRVRSTQNPDDRKYFIHKMDSLFKTLQTLSSVDMIDDKKLSRLDKEFELTMDGFSDTYKELRLQCDSVGYVIAGYVYNALLKEFPQFERLTITSITEKDIKPVKITYLFFKDNSVVYYNESKGRWSKFYMR